MLAFVFDLLFVFYILYLEALFLLRISDKKHSKMSLKQFSLIGFFSCILKPLECIAWVSVFLNILTLFVIWIHPKWQRFRGLKSLDKDFNFFVDQVLLNMKSGLSFQGSYKKSLSSVGPKWSRNFIQGLFLEVSLNKKYKNVPKKVGSFCKILQKIHESPHKAFDLLSLLKSRWAFEESLKEEMDSVLIQVRIQSGVMVLFYVLCSFWYFSYSAPLSYFLISIFFFAAGFLLHCKIQKAVMWSP